MFLSFWDGEYNTNPFLFIIYLWLKKLSRTNIKKTFDPRVACRPGRVVVNKHIFKSGLNEILLVKLKNFHISACLNLNYGTAKQKLKLWSVWRWWELSKFVINTVSSLSLVTCLISAGEKRFSRNKVCRSR